MRVLFDQGTPAPLRRHLQPHSIDTAFERGWSTLRNGDLLDRAEADGYDAFVTTDTNLRYQQNLELREIGILVLSTTSWPRIRPRAIDIKIALETLDAGDYQEFQV